MENIIFVKTMPLNSSRQQFTVLPNCIETELISDTVNDREGNSHLCVYINLISDGKILFKNGFIVDDKMEKRFEMNCERIMYEAKRYFDMLMVRALSENLTSHKEGVVTVLDNDKLECIRINLLNYIYEFIDENYKETTSEPESTPAPSSKDSNTQKKKKK